MVRSMIFPLIIGVLGAAILVSLGNWQLQRLAQKEATISRIEKMIAGRIGEIPADAVEARDEFLGVQITGEIVGKPIFVLTSRKGFGPGYRVLYRLETSELALIVDLGFLRGAPKDPGVSGVYEIGGNLMWPDETDGFTPPPDIDRRIWFARDLQSLAPTFETASLLVVARQTTPPIEGIRPWPVSTSGIANDHLQYAITWFSLAVVWMGMTGYWLWRIRRRSLDDAMESTP